jgi:radical SAM protein with 4Fe4S-binding SPASM domain
MCGQWGDTGVFRPDGTVLSGGADLPDSGGSERSRIRELIGAKRQLALSDYVRLLDQIAPSRPTVSLFGGEPLLYPDILPLVREIKRRGLTCTMITNAWRLPEVARELVEAGIDTVAVSVDGPPDVHDRIRGETGSFERVAEGVRALDRARKELGVAVPMAIAILPVTELNLGDMGRALESLRDLPLDTINVGLRWFVSRPVGQAYEKVMSETFGVAGDSWKGFEFDGAGFAGTMGPELAELAKLLKRVRRGRFVDATLGKPWVSFVPDIPAEDVPRYFAEEGQTFGHDLCPVAWYFAQVEPDGQVCFCGDFPDYVLGNVRETPFREIWTGERATRFREKLAKEPLPICSRCCGSYVYGRFSRPGVSLFGGEPLRSAPGRR